ncbi:PH domain-containing protein [Rufibacter latericius]|uniref:Uncharacterized protein YyaB-like PH domain-containing protein n=1 Tax=Rufibacter latericius TaxID=2487040 RepID=A0A3M9MN34_9BACT|nr:PH domain-containing protein [Rufibacter latericius]RNI26952.1 hypothetical protein EFB08_10820 [Rufibacter latericius]
MVSLTFRSSKSWVSALGIWGTIALLSAVMVQELQSNLPLPGKIGLALFCVLLSGLLLWMWFGTYYRTCGEMLHFRCGPLHGKILIQQIREIHQNQSPWSGFRPALGLNGLIIHYNRWDTVYLSPAQKQEFLWELQQVKPEIVVKN